MHQLPKDYVAHRWSQPALIAPHMYTTAACAAHAHSAAGTGSCLPHACATPTPNTYGDETAMRALPTNTQHCTHSNRRSFTHSCMQQWAMQLSTRSRHQTRQGWCHSQVATHHAAAANHCAPQHTAAAAAAAAALALLLRAQLLLRTAACPLQGWRMQAHERLAACALLCVRNISTRTMAVPAAAADAVCATAAAACRRRRSRCCSRCRRHCCSCSGLLLQPLLSCQRHRITPAGLPQAPQDAASHGH